jgi:hypothetical protein
MGMGDTFDKVRGNAFISIPADIRWQKMSVAVGFLGRGNAYYNEKRTVSSAL